MNRCGIVIYPYLEGKIAERGIKKAMIAKCIGISPRALSNKFTGKSEFTWSQARTIQLSFFPDIEKDILFFTSYINNKSNDNQ